METGISGGKKQKTTKAELEFGFWTKTGQMLQLSCKHSTSSQVYLSDL